MHYHVTMTKHKYGSLLLSVLVLTLSVSSAFFLDDFEDVEEEDPGEARVLGKLPNFHLETYLNIAMEPHNAMVQVLRQGL
jgi:hypothetical protein